LWNEDEQDRLAKSYRVFWVKFVNDVKMIKYTFCGHFDTFNSTISLTHHFYVKHRNNEHPQMPTNYHKNNNFLASDNVFA
jgi:hypothetical protein